jgi:hypothetical protein
MLALLAGMLVATTGFTVLSASTSVQRLEVEQTVEASERPQFDILVRPKDSRTELEEERGLVPPNYLSGLYGGITPEQLAEIRGVGNVETAAPIAMLGHSLAWFTQEVDLTDLVDPTARQQLFRVTPEWITDRGLTVLDDAPQYVYLTRNDILGLLPIPGGGYDTERYADGSHASSPPGCLTVLEVHPDGRREEICNVPTFLGSYTGTTPLERTGIQVSRVDEAGRFTDSIWPGQPPADRLVVTISWRVLVPVAAIDPAAEAELAHLDDALVSGRYLTADDPFQPSVSSASQVTPAKIPALVAGGALIDEQLGVSVERFNEEQAAVVPGQPLADWIPRLATMAGTPSGPPIRRTGLPGLDEANSVDLGTFYQPGPVGYRTDEAGALRPEVVPAPAPETWTIGEGTNVLQAVPPPRTAMADGFRPLVQKGGPPNGMSPGMAPVGVFDPARLDGLLNVYATPEATGADDRSRELLGGEPLLPGAGATGYLNGPPLILTNFTALEGRVGVNHEAPISAVRIRVAGVTGVDERSQELVRATAENIATRTGLDVDVMLGSSPAPRTVVLPASADGRPELTVTETWTLKGAAVAIVQAADRKSLLLFALILLVCTLFLGNAVAAAVRDRRRELAVLACLGWPAGRLAGTVFIEVTAVGLVAGTLAAAVALPLAGVLGVSLSLGHALLGLPVGLGIAMLAAAPAALSAGRAQPGAAVHPAVLGVRRARRRNSVLGLALGNLWRVPGRTALGVGALAVGVGALTMLVLIAVVFRNEVVGSLLGDAVAVRVRSVDLLAAVTAVALGALMVADVLYINVRERSAELAALWAGGWSNGAMLRLVGYEGLGMGVLGGALGAVAGLLGAIWFSGRLGLDMILLAVIVATGATVIAGAAAILPALALRRLPLSTVLAEE